MKDLHSVFRSAPIYAIFDTNNPLPLPPQEAVGAWLRAGIRVIQYRHKGVWAADQFATCSQLSAMIHQQGGIFVVNDRPDVALLCQADGVHVGQDDLPPTAVRKLLPAPAIVGHSTHNINQLIAAASMPVDYIAVGPIFSTASKMNPDPVVGMSLIRQARTLTRFPLVAIGGITLNNLGSVLEAGATAIAVISGLILGCKTTQALEARAIEILDAAISAGSPAPDVL